MNNTISSNQRPGGILISLAVFVHLVDFFILGFDMSNPVSWITRVLLYLLLAVIGASLLSSGPGDSRTKTETFVVSAIAAIGIPLILSLLRLLGLSQSQSQPFEWAIFVVPVWILYLVGYKGIWGNSFFTRALVGIYLIGLMLSFLMFISVDMINTGRIADLTFEGSSINPSLVVGSFYSDFIVAPIINIREGFSDNVNATALRERNFENVFRNGNNYRGNVEDVSTETGIFLDNLNVRDEYRAGSSIRIPANIRVRTFDENQINMEFECIAVKDNGGEVIGNISPSNMIFEGLDSNTVFCEFDDLELGNYRFRFDATANFYTAASSDFYFVSGETVQGLFEGNERIDARSFGIPSSPETIFTKGPVSLKMENSQVLPIEVYNDRQTNFFLDWRLENANARSGEIRSVRTFDIHLPEIFDLESEGCTLPMQESIAQSEENENYKVYSFELDGDNISSRDLGCNVALSAQNADNFVGNGVRDLTEATVFTEVTYDYTLIERSRFRVIR